MVQLKRKQPMRACRDPPPVYFEGKSDSADEETKTAALVEKERRVNQLTLRPGVPLPEPATVLPVQPILSQSFVGRIQRDGHDKVKNGPRLWSQLHPDLVECILGHLPVSTLRKTVMAIDPTRWRQILSSNKYGNTSILGHGNHVDSSIGCIKTYFIPHRREYLPPEDNLCPPPPRALEHTTNTWQLLPRFPDSNIRQQLKVQSVSEGLILMVMPDSHGCRPGSPATPGLGYRHRLVTWNPVSHSHRWIPMNRLKYREPDRYYCLELLVVNPDKTGYMVVEFFESVRANPPFVPAAGRGFIFPHYYPQRLQQKQISGYAVYDSGSGTWGAVQRPPQNISELHFNHDKSYVSCDEGCVCFVNVEMQIPGMEMPVGIVCWNSCTNVWSEALFPLDFFKRPGSLPGCFVKKLLYADGKVYMIFARAPRKRLYTHFIVAISLADIQSGIASFQHVGSVREFAGWKSKSRSRQNHRPPTRSRVKPDELILQRPMCSRWCIDRWYMLPVGRSSQLCVELCGRYIKRFDLDARVWTESVMEMASDSDSTFTRTVLPSGGIYLWVDNYHPYIPSWVKA